MSVFLPVCFSVTVYCDQAPSFGWKVPNSLGTSDGASTLSVKPTDGSINMKKRRKGKKYLPMGHLLNHLIHFALLGKELPHCQNNRKVY
jgi:hypothetical protein